jgi:hypothetical protein
MTLTQTGKMEYTDMVVMNYLPEWATRHAYNPVG